MILILKMIERFFKIPPIRLFFFLFALSIAIQFTFTLYIHFVKNQGNILDVDTYDTLAQNILSHREFSTSLGKPSAEREPLYPIVLALIYALLGRSWFSIFLLHTCLAGMGLWLLYILAKEIFGSRVAQLSMALYAFYPFTHYYVASLNRENLFIPIFLAANLFALKAYRTHSLKWVSYSTITFALLILCRAPFLPYVVLVGLILCWYGEKRKRIKILALYFSLFVVVISPWVIRNRLVFDRWIMGTTLGGLVLYMSLLIPYNVGHVPLAQPLYDKTDPFVIKVLSLPKAQADQVFYEASFQYLRNHPWNFFKRFFMKVIKLWRFYPYPDRHYGFPFHWIQLVYLLSDGWLIPLGFLALGLWWRHWHSLIFLWAPIVTLTFTHGIFWSQTRFRLPLMPLLIICVAALCLQGRRPEFQEAVREQ